MTKKGEGYCVFNSTESYFCRLAAWFESLGQEQEDDKTKESNEQEMLPDAAALMRKLAAFHKTCTFLKQQVGYYLRAMHSLHRQSLIIHNSSYHDRPGLWPYLYAHTHVPSR
jgi:hypothetical protein